MDENRAIRIERISDISEVMKCLPFERTIRKKKRDITRESDMLLFVQSNLLSPLFGFFIAYNGEDEIIGYLVGYLSLFPGFERMQLLRLYMKEPWLEQEFKKVVDEWVKPFKIKIVQITVSKNVKAIQRKHKFIPVSINMERRLR